VTLSQGFDQLVHGARRIELCVPVDAPAEDTGGHAVKEQLHIRVSADPVSPQLVRTA